MKLWHKVKHMFRYTPSKLPKKLRAKTIAELGIFYVGYASSWALLRDENDGLWIRGDYEVRSKPFRGSIKFTRTLRGVKIELSDLLVTGIKLKAGRVEHAIKYWKALAVRIKE